MSMGPTTPATQTYNDGAITPGTQRMTHEVTQAEEHATCSIERLVSRQVWACSTEAARWERLIALRAAIYAGTYRVEAQVLADCLLRSAVDEHRATSSMYPS